MATGASRGEITFEGFCALVREWQKADLIDGMIYMASPESVRANMVLKEILARSQQ